jgi:hypothetical protein
MSSLLIGPRAANVPDKTGHIHRWRIDEQAGPQSAGTCRCGTPRLFKNGWEGDSAIVLGSGNWVAASRRRSVAPR